MTTVPRSNFVTALAWVFIVLTGFATLMSIMQNLMVQLMFPDFDSVPQPRDGAAIPPWASFTIRNLRWIFLFFLTVCAASFATSVGLLKRRNWARRGFIAIMGLAILWNVVGVAAIPLFFSALPPIPDPAEGGGNFALMMKAMVAFNVLLAIAFCVLFGWIIKRLMSVEIRREFGAA